jgi:cell division septation protein DedD
MRIEHVALGAMLALNPSIAHAQLGLLDHAEARITGGEFSDARGLLDRWRRQNPGASRTDQEQMARYLLLSGRVTTNADSAEYNYLTVAVDYPTARVAPEALLRLAQARYTRGDTTQAVSYLERLIADYPSSEHRPIGAFWLARVKAKGPSAAVCETMRNIGPGTNPETIEYFKKEQTRVCGGAVANVKPPSPARPAPGRITPAPKADTALTPKSIVASEKTTSPGRVSIQVGAFREFSGARGVQRQLENAGFTDVRLVRVPGNQLIRVRIGKFENRAAAAATLSRLASANYSAVLVTDANSETRVTN